MGEAREAKEADDEETNGGEGGGVRRRLVIPWFTGTRAWVHDALSRRRLERGFRASTDPWAYEKSEYEQTRLDALAGMVADRRYGEALEIGCAEGVFTERMAPFCERITAVEFSPTAHARAEARLRHLPSGRVTVHLDNIRSWAPPTGTRFDLIVASDVLYYLETNGGHRLLHEPEFGPFLKRMAGWLAPSGRMLVSHAFIGEEERRVRVTYRERLERAGLRLERETEVGRGLDKGETVCLMSLLRREGISDAS